MKKIFYVIFLSSVTFLFSCTSQKKKSEVSFIKIKEFEIAVNSRILVSINKRISQHNSEKTFKIFFQDIKTKKILSFDINKDSLKFVSDTLYNTRNYFCDLFFYSNDLIYSFHNNINKITLENNHGENLKTYQISEKYAAVSSPNCKLTGNNNYLLLANASRIINVGTLKNRLKYYKQIKPLLLVNIKDSIYSYKAIGDFPEKYISTGDDYNEFIPSACFGSNNNICVSFSADNYLYIYNNSNLILKKKVKSKFIKKFKPYPDDKNFDMLFLKNYIIKEPKYLSVIYDPWQKLYFRMVKHRGAISVDKNSSGNSWSVIALDTELNILGEKQFNYQYNPDVFVPTPFGILMARSLISDDSKTVFTLIKIKKNE